MIWSPQQDAALQNIEDWFRNQPNKQVFYLAGYAGTGKTTLAKYIAEALNVYTLYAAFTGKAALVLRNKGCDEASTIHSLIYVLKDSEEDEPEFILNKGSALHSADLLIVDEVSMVDEILGRDLLSFNKKILVIGDPAQLPPISGAGFFTSGKPDVLLTEIHRQAKDNPIIYLSMLARLGHEIPLGTYGNSKVILRESAQKSDIMDVEQLIVGKNNTRKIMNDRIREKLNLRGSFQKSDKIICLKNDRIRGLLNGSMWEIEDVLSQTNNVSKIRINSLDGLMTRPMKIQAHHCFFRGEERNYTHKELAKYGHFDFGYAITCHKSQGSQWDKLTIFDESSVFREHKNRWLYTAITRAANELTIVR